MPDIECPSCKTILSISPYAVGKTIACWECGAAIAVVETEPDRSPPPAPERDDEGDSRTFRIAFGDWTWTDEWSLWKPILIVLLLLFVVGPAFVEVVHLFRSK